MIILIILVLCFHYNQQNIDYSFFLLTFRYYLRHIINTKLAY